MNLLLLTLTIAFLATAQDCPAGQFLSVDGECVSCDTATGDQCGSVCLNRVWDGLNCIDCLVQPGVDPNADPSYGQCICLPGMYWMGPSFQCSSCSQIQQSQLCPIFCPGFYYNSLASACVTCANLPNIDTNFVADSEVIVIGCTCQRGYGWENQQCIPCAETTQQACRSSTCSDFIWSSTVCGDCSNLENTNSIRLTPINSVCLCDINFVWSSAGQACITCTEATTQEECLDENCYGFTIWSNNACVTCKDIANADSSVQQFPYLRYCTCLPEYFWNSQTSTCPSCSTSPQNGCGSNNCINYFWAKNKCQSCFTLSNTIPKVALTTDDKLFSCVCSKGYIWSNNTLSCVNCNQAEGFALVTTINLVSNACINCSTIKNARTGLAIGELSLNYSCLCASNYKFIKGICTCALPLFDVGRSLGCFPCNRLPGGVAYFANGTCSCVAGATWNLKLNSCQCNLTTHFIVAGRGCQPCSSLGAGLTYGISNISSPGECICSYGLAWDFLLNTCVCKEANKIWLNGTCSACNLAILYSNGSRNTPTSCFCRENMMWNVSLRSCMCIANSFPLSKTNCILCSNLPGSTGRGFSTGCFCSAGWEWNAASLQCICLNSSCTCGSGFVLRGKNCFRCSNYTFSTGKNINNTFCECIQSFTWDNILGRCFCPSTSVLGGNVCYSCVLANSASSKSKTSNACVCSTNYVWQQSQLSCVFSSTVDVIMLHNGTKVSCKGLGSSTGLSYDNFNCRCSSNFFWKDTERKCVSCSSLKYSNGTSSSGISCFCQTGYGWDPIASDCKSLQCTFRSNLGECTGCYSLPGVATTVMVVDYVSGVFLSGDNAILSLYANVTARINERFLPFRCMCASGYGWNRARRRCFATSINGKF